MQKMLVYHNQTCPMLEEYFRYILSIYIKHAVLMMSVPGVRFQKGEGDLHAAASETDTNKTKPCLTGR